MSYEPDDSAERVSRLRRCEKGDHSICNPDGNCKAAAELLYRNEAHLLAVAVFDELATRDMPAALWFGDGYGEARELADTVLPDYDYLPREPDRLCRLQAKRAVAARN